MVKFPFGGKKEPAVSPPNLNQLQGKEAELLQQLQRIQAQIRGLQDEAKTFFEAIQKEKHGFEYEERILKDFINKLTILMGQLALQLRAVAGFVKDGYIQDKDRLYLTLYDEIERIKRTLFDILHELSMSGRGFSNDDISYLLSAANIISNAQRDDGYGHNANYNASNTPQSILDSLIARALNDVMWVALQLKELKKLYSKEEKWRVAEEDIVKNCMKMLDMLHVDKDVKVLVSAETIHTVRRVLAGNDYYAHFQLSRVDHDIKQLLGHVNTAEREEEATQHISNQFHSLASKIEDIIKLIYQRLTRVYGYNHELIYFLTNLRRVQTIEIDTSKLVEALQSVYSYDSTFKYDRQVHLTYIDPRSIPRVITPYNENVVKFKAVVEKKLTLMQAIDRKLREGFSELNAMISANKAIGVLSSQEIDSLHQLIGGTKALETQLRHARRRKR